METSELPWIITDRLPSWALASIARMEPFFATTAPHPHEAALLAEPPYARAFRSWCVVAPGTSPALWKPAGTTTPDTSSITRVSRGSSPEDDDCGDAGGA